MGAAPEQMRTTLQNIVPVEKNLYIVSCEIGQFTQNYSK